MRNDVFGNEDFWVLYLTLENVLYDENGNILKEIEEITYKNILTQLSTDFSVHSDIVHFYFQLNNFELLIESRFGCSNYLYLCYQEEKYLLGWWDLAMWHPYCLKYDELNLLLENIQKYDANWKNSDVPLLLLKDFVGFGSDEQKECKELTTRSKNVLDSLKIKNSKLLSTCFLQDDYSWRTTSVGDEFSADYNCYSLRNVQHQSKESSFPFELWNKLIDSLQ
ncbi:hypothetical protein QJU89_07665 [Pasteurella skyensis]|uniref:Uncharacterized protein n=1 Tax=Phocoenobacter skyensis TaxID=97481 RepID=A0AAJ6NE97_9PAST|nr:hypothetical protein [Pasteurella skyensis]MDP8162958.1 hypothetical protein [Pasteurella skyensis]MDP8170921.1 hypothetical protein [Pasteurella skyensis]MDP8172890.1 hypothetical protein [Pasteurella skyensis]MDP8175167.1 hypothetical protein [Pasteurella skyensis]MDP8176664.1 hypothetical protein [Pasteurella skyensis]